MAARQTRRRPYELLPPGGGWAHLSDVVCSAVEQCWPDAKVPAHRRFLRMGLIQALGYVGASRPDLLSVPAVEAAFAEPLVRPLPGLDPYPWRSL